MKTRILSFAFILAAVPVLAQNPFVVDSWEGVSTDQVQGDSTGALILAQVGTEVNLAFRRPAVDQGGRTVRITDGATNRNSAWNSLTEDAFNFFIQVDLEEPRLIDRVVVVPVDNNDTDFMKGYSISTSRDNIVFREVVLKNFNLDNLIDTTFAPVVARFVRVQVKAIDRVHVVQASELEVFGGGSVNEGVFESASLDFSRARNFGRVRWEAEATGGGEVRLQFRTGPTATPNARWSDWSEPSAVDDREELLDLPEPRRYLQYRVNFSTANPQSTPRLTRLEVDSDDPLASRVTGAVRRDLDALAAPDSVEEGTQRRVLEEGEVPVGAERRLLYSLRATLGGGRGFDVVRLKLPNRARIERVVRDGVELAMPADYGLSADGASIDIRLSAAVVSDTEFEIGFSTVLFDELNRFGGQILDSQKADNPQEIEAASDEALVLFGVGLVDKVFDKNLLKVEPNPFSPNGDGRFDVVEIRYQLAKIDVPRPVTLRIFDLTGRPVRELEFLQKSGTHVVEWDGRDDDDDLVPPGLYLFQIDVASGGKDGIERNGAIAVSY